MIGTILSFIGWRYILIALIVVGGVGTGINYIVSWVSPSNSTNLKKEEKQKEIEKQKEKEEKKFWDVFNKSLKERMEKTNELTKKAYEKFDEEWSKKIKEEQTRMNKILQEEYRKINEFEVNTCLFIYSDKCKEQDQKNAKKLENNKTEKQDQLVPKSDKENNPPKIENQEKEVATPENTKQEIPKSSNLNTDKIETSTNIETKTNE